MKVLVIYGQNVLGKRLMLRLTKEDYYVVCIDKKVEGLDKRYTEKECSLDFAESLQEAFRINNFDGVIYLGDSVIDYAGPYTNGGVLEQALLLCGEYHVERFMYVCQNNYELVPELEVRKGIDEHICDQYSKIFHGSLKVVSFNNIYGEDMRCGLLYRLLRSAENKSGCPIKQGAELVYLDDAIDLLWRVWNDVSGKRKFALKCSEYVTDMGSLYASICSMLHGDGEQTTIEVCDTTFVDDEFLSSIQWKPKYKLNGQLKIIVETYKNRYKESTKEVPINWRKIVQPYIENIALFLILILINRFQDGRHVISLTQPDFAYVYIMIMGLLYGKIQAAWAVFLSSILIIFRYMNYGVDLVSIFYSVEPLIHVAAYMFLGTAVGYVTDSKNKQMDEYVRQLGDFKRRFDFLYNNYLQTVSLKDTFYKQVLNNSNSLGRTAHIVRQLESVHPDQLYLAACDVVCEFLGVDNASLYTINHTGSYLRLRVRKGEACENIPQSLKIENYPYLVDVVKDKHFFINKELQKDVPDMAAPILYGDKTIAVILLYAVPFEKFTVQSEVMLKIVSLLIAFAMRKAVMFEELLFEKMYLPDTRIMRSEYFLERLAEAERQENARASTFRMAELIAVKGITIREFVQQNKYKDLWNGLAHLIREEDVVGIAENDKIRILFFDLSETFVPTVTNRLKEEGVELKWLETPTV